MKFQIQSKSSFYATSSML